MPWYLLFDLFALGPTTDSDHLDWPQYLGTLLIEVRAITRSADSLIAVEVTISLGECPVSPGQSLRQVSVRAVNIGDDSNMTGAIGAIGKSRLFLSSPSFQHEEGN